MYLWSNSEGISDTCHPQTNPCNPRLHIVRSKTSCLTLVTNVGAFPLLWTKSFCAVRYSHKSSLFKLTSELPHTVWWALASHPVRSSSFLSALYSTWTTVRHWDCFCLLLLFYYCLFGLLEAGRFWFQYWCCTVP